MRQGLGAPLKTGVLREARGPDDCRRHPPPGCCATDRVVFIRHNKNLLSHSVPNTFLNTRQ